MPCPRSPSNRADSQRAPARQSSCWDTLPVKRHPHPICQVCQTDTPAPCQEQMQTILSALYQQTILLQEVHLLLLQHFGNNL